MNLVAFLLDRYPTTKTIIQTGSHVYGTNHQASDLDLVLILNQQDIPESIRVENMDLYFYTETSWRQALDRNEAKALELVFTPKEFLLYGVYDTNVKIHGPYLRKTFGEVCRHAWDRGMKKLTKEVSPHEHYIGKKSLFHSLRMFIMAKQLYETGQLDWAEIKKTNTIYLELLSKSRDEILAELGKYQGLYKQYDKAFREIPNEEQLRQKEKLLETSAQLRQMLKR